MHLCWSIVIFVPLTFVWNLIAFKILFRKRFWKRKKKKRKKERWLTCSRLGQKPRPKPPNRSPTHIPPLPRGLVLQLAQPRTSPLPLYPIGRQVGPAYPSLWPRGLLTFVKGNKNKKNSASAQNINVAFYWEYCRYCYLYFTAGKLRSKNLITYYHASTNLINQLD